MARHQITYVETDDPRSGRTGAAILLDLGGARPGPPARVRPPLQERRACPAWLALVGLIALMAAGVLLAEVTTGPDERAAAHRSVQAVSLRG